MITLDTTRHQQSVVGAAWLVELAFTSGTLRYTTAPVSISALSQTWLGLGALASVSGVTESEEVQADAINLSLSIVDTALITASLGSVENYRGKAARVYLQLLDETFQPAGTAVRRWSGLMDRVEIKRSQGQDGSSGVVELRCSRNGIGRMRNAQGLRLTHEQQLRRFAGDTGLRYVRTLIEKPTVWLSKKFQESR